MRKSENNYPPIAMNKDYIASADQDNIYLWNADTGIRARTLNCKETVTALALSPDNHFMGIATASGELQLMNVTSGEYQRLLPNHYKDIDASGKRIHSMCFNPQGKYFAAAISRNPFVNSKAGEGEDNSINVWDTKDGSLKCHVKIEPIGYLGFTLNCIQLICKATRYLNRGDDDSLQNLVVITALPLISFATDEFISNAQRHNFLSMLAKNISYYCSNRPLVDHSKGWDKVNVSIFSNIAISTSEKYVAFGNSKDIVLHRNGNCFTSGEYDLKGHTQNVHQVAFSPDERYLASAGEDNAVRIWDVNSRKCTAVLQDFEGSAKTLLWRITLSQYFLVASVTDQTLRCWQVTQSKSEVQIVTKWIRSPQIADQLQLLEGMLKHLTGELTAADNQDSPVVVIDEALVKRVRDNDATLTSLVLRDLNNQGLRLLAPVLQESKVVTALDLSGNRLCANGMEGMKLLGSVLERSHSITYLNLLSCFSASVNANESLQKLNEELRVFGNTGMTILAPALKRNTSLRSLHMGFNFFGAQAMLLLANALCKHENLTELNLALSSIEAEGVNHLRPLFEKGNQLQSIDFTNCHFVEAQLKTIHDGLTSNTTLTSMKLDQGNTSAEKALVAAIQAKTEQNKKQSKESAKDSKSAPPHVVAHIVIAAVLAQKSLTAVPNSAHSSLQQSIFNTAGAAHAQTYTARSPLLSPTTGGGQKHHGLSDMELDRRDQTSSTPIRPGRSSGCCVIA